MTRITKFFALAGALTTLTFATVAIAGPHGGPEGAVMHAFKELDLTPEQREQLKEIRERNRESREGAREQRRESMEVFREELLSDTPDSKRLHKLIDERQADAQQRAHDKLDTVLEIHSVLTPSQRTELAEILSEMRERHQAERSERRGERRRGR